MLLTTDTITLSLYPNIPETLWVVRRCGRPTPFVVRKLRCGRYCLDTFCFSYGEKPLFSTLRDAKAYLREFFADPVKQLIWLIGIR